MTESEFQKYQLIPLKITGRMSDTDTSVENKSLEFVFKFSNESCESQNYITDTSNFTFGHEVSFTAPIGNNFPPIPTFFADKEEIPNIKGLVAPFVRINGIDYPIDGACCLTIDWNDVTTEMLQLQLRVNNAGAVEGGNNGKDVHVKGSVCQMYDGVQRDLHAVVTFGINPYHSNTTKFWQVLNEFVGAVLSITVTDETGGTTLKTYTSQPLTLDNFATSGDRGEVIHLNLDEKLFSLDDSSAVGFNYKRFRVQWNITKQGRVLTGSNNFETYRYRFVSPYFRITHTLRPANNAARTTLIYLEADEEGFPNITLNKATVDFEVSYEDLGEDNWTNFKTFDTALVAQTSAVYTRVDGVPAGVKRTRSRIKIGDDCYIYSSDIRAY